VGRSESRVESVEDILKVGGRDLFFARAVSFEVRRGRKRGRDERDLRVRRSSLARTAREEQSVKKGEGAGKMRKDERGF
jgi:hypothetical protein